MTSLAGRVTLVTGASRGIGKAIALELAKQGAQVVGTATSEGGAQAITQYFNDAGLPGVGRLLEVRDDAQISATLDAISQAHGKLYLLVNNAGITRDNLLMRMKDSEWDDIMEVNLKSVFRLCRGVLRDMMRAREGRIINITSVVGESGNAGQCNYAASKGAVISFTKSLAQEIASRGITVNCVAPGFIETDMTAALTDAQRDAAKQHIPLGRLGAPEDIAAAVAYLASPGASYVTGATLDVNGGMYMR
ncbi:MAG: 3-oxoacyl-ACP reductase FabG [Betaproteobacteria bacterium]|nr:3-oxoacyl-ACP reductase FabG [Betaproteobacteria bacterium]